ncbi:MAG: response regulator, partial [Chloroflexota bacterium]
MKNKPTQILILEDNPSDAELMKRELRKAELDAVATLAQDKATFIDALESSTLDLILADYALPGFDGMTALVYARQRFPEIPVIIVSGAIGEEIAIEALKAGATDYVLKQRLDRLGPVIQRALQEAQQKAERKKAEALLAERNTALLESEERFRLLVEGVEDYAIIMLDTEGLIVSWNTGAERIKGWAAEEILGHNFSLFYLPQDREIGQPQRALEQAAVQGRYEGQG